MSKDNNASMVIQEDRSVIIDKVAQYLHWLTIPKKEFGNMPVCPFLDKELKQDNRYIDIWYPTDNSFMDLMESFLLSSKNSALIICPNTHTIDYSEVERKTIQAKITQILRDNPQTEYLKSLVISPYEPWTLAGVETRSGSPYFLINVSPAEQFGKTHKDLLKTKYFQNYTDADKKKMNVK